jgi:hypothetical protein
MDINDLLNYTAAGIVILITTAVAFMIERMRRDLNKKCKNW